VTARDALHEGQLHAAIALQERAVAAAPTHGPGRLFLFELLLLAGQTREADETLRQLDSPAEDWPTQRRQWLRLIRAEDRRTPTVHRPKFLHADVPLHAKRRWNALRAERTGQVQRALLCSDAADGVTPEVQGYIDGREFLGLRDTDDRFASVLELFVAGEYVWLPFEHLRTLSLQPAVGPLDVAFRPATVTLSTGETWGAIVPMRYPSSAEAGPSYALGEQVDWHTETDSLICAVGAKVLTAGEEEVILAQCRMIEIRCVQPVHRDV